MGSIAVYLRSFGWIGWKLLTLCFNWQFRVCREVPLWSSTVNLFKNYLGATKIKSIKSCYIAARLPWCPKQWTFYWNLDHFTETPSVKKDGLNLASQHFLDPKSTSTKFLWIPHGLTHGKKTWIALSHCNFNARENTLTITDNNSDG